jgi:hypothetical protein
VGYFVLYNINVAVVLFLGIGSKTIRRRWRKAAAKLKLPQLGGNRRKENEHGIEKQRKSGIWCYF